MKLLAATLLIVLLVASPRAPQDQDPGFAMEVHETVVRFLELLGGLRFYALGQYMTKDANIITARWSRGSFVNRVQSSREWLDGLMEGPGPRPFRKELTNVEIVRDTGVASFGVVFFSRWCGRTTSGSSPPSSSRQSPQANYQETKF